MKKANEKEWNCQRDHCQQNQLGVHDYQCAKNANRQTNLVKKKKLAEWKKLTRKNDTAEKTIAGKTWLRARAIDTYITSRVVFTPKRQACGLTVCVTRKWAGVDNVWEQEKPEARKMLENAAESHTSGARFVGRVTANILLNWNNIFCASASA